MRSQRSVDELVQRMARRYEITTEYAAELMARQVCDACRQSGGPMAIDHSHQTGYVRGRLCGSCNSSLATARDDYQTLLLRAGRAIALADYLKTSSARELAEGWVPKTLTIDQPRSVPTSEERLARFIQDLGGQAAYDLELELAEEYDLARRF